MKTLHVIPIAVIGPGETPPRVRMRPLYDGGIGLLASETFEQQIEHFKDKARKAIDDMIGTSTGATIGGTPVPLEVLLQWAKSLPQPRHCICCGAPENEVTHD